MTARAAQDRLQDGVNDRVPDRLHDRMANAIRGLAMDAVEQAKSGHPGLPMGAADVATVLFTRCLKFDPADPAWPDRDRFVLSAGHGSMLIYAVLHLLGYEAMTIEQIKRFRQLGSITAGHPEYGHTPGIETTTGPLGQGLGNAVGMALAERMLAAQFGDDLVDHHTFVLASDGDLMEGLSHEAIALAGHLKLNRLIVLFDDNGISIDGPLTLSDSVDQVKRFQAAGWAASRIDGHDPDAIHQAIEAARKSDRPTLIACKTTIGFGAPKKAGTSKAHGEPLGAEELAGAKQALALGGAFEVPPEVIAAWRAAGERSRAVHAAWKQRLAAKPADVRAEFLRRLSGARPSAMGPAVAALKKKLAVEPPTVATRKASEIALEVLTEAVPELILGSADLTPSNNTRTKNSERRGARKLRRPVRSLRHPRARHGGRHERHRVARRLHCVRCDLPGVHRLRTSLDAARRAHGAARGLRDDPRFHRAGRGWPDPPAGRASRRPARHPEHARVPPGRRHGNRGVLAARARAQRRPDRARADAPEPAARCAGTPVANRCAEGAYELAGAEGAAQATLFATGSEVEIALAAQALLEQRGVATRVVSVPSVELFLARPADQRRAIIGDAKVKVAIEAAVRQGWDAIIGADGLFVGMNSFGASAPAKDLYRHFGITAEKVAEAVLTKIKET